jgi:hypothetical protein
MLAAGHHDHVSGNMAFVCTCLAPDDNRAYDPAEEIARGICLAAARQRLPYRVRHHLKRYH